MSFCTAPTFVDRQDALSRLCAEWQKAPALALDTEFDRTRTFFVRPALLQVSDGIGNYLIDPLVIDDLRPLLALIEDPGIAKVLHSCSEDLEVVQHLGGKTIAGSSRKAASTYPLWWARSAMR